MARAAWLLVLISMGVACDDEGTINELEIGTLVVEVLTTGADSLDSNGYAIDIDNGVNVAGSQLNDTTSIELFAGAHSVLLSDVASQCDVAGDNPVTTTIADGVTTNLSFSVACP
jgi:hypothetical protein